MSPDREQINPDRLIDASIAVLKATVEYADAHRGRSIHPSELLGHPEQPEILCHFTRFEVEEATAFLVRMGMIDPPRPGKRAA